MDFDPGQSRFELRPFVLCRPVSPHPDQVRCPSRGVGAAVGRDSRLRRSVIRSDNWQAKDGTELALTACVIRVGWSLAVPPMMVAGAKRLTVI
jgi:hypothetical protein